MPDTSWAMAHPWLTFFLVLAAFDALVKLTARCFRFCSVAFHGWPPPHLDADGDSIDVYVARAKAKETP